MNNMLPDDEGSKVNACMNNIFQIWRDTAPERLTQLVFCDYSTPNADGRFNVYDDIKAKLLEKGVPAEEVAFIHDASTDTRKKELFAKVRKGQVRVPFGSTAKMGARTNVQDKLIGKPFPQEADLTEKSARLSQLDALLNMSDSDEPEQAGATPLPERAACKSERPSVLDKLKSPGIPGALEKKKDARQEVR